eukprot:TRINITY_DN15232_c0_g1_i1.p1 TRINITY_DN15232_c0_g1~~TRINITY_DN15232_c0_g1_i1.p1  ORF type:complete len:203 (-),score=31.67 TRINITY_DN15232_c0_g1_i1:82-657(-)
MTDLQLITDAPKILGALLNGVVKKVFDRDPEVTTVFLHEQLYADKPEITVEVVEREVAIVKDILLKAGFEDFDLTQFETFLKQTSLTAGQQEAFARFWRTQKPKIHDALVRDVSWADTLSRLQWRIDSKSKSKNVDDLNNELTAVVELSIGGPRGDKAEPQAVRFEMDRAQVSTVLEQINAIQAQVSKLSS